MADFEGKLTDARLRLKVGMIRWIALQVIDQPDVRDRSHLVRTLLREAIAARRLRSACRHDWHDERCRRCQRTEAEALDAPHRELVLRFQSKRSAALFKTSARSRTRMLAHADWRQGGFVPVPDAA